MAERYILEIFTLIITSYFSRFAEVPFSTNPIVRIALPSGNAE